MSTWLERAFRVGPRCQQHTCPFCGIKGQMRLVLTAVLCPVYVCEACHTAVTDWPPQSGEKRRTRPLAGCVRAVAGLRAGLQSTHGGDAKESTSWNDV